MFNLIIFGPPGCGKGTQSKLVASTYHFLHLSTGDLFRYEIARGSGIGDVVKKFIDRGLLIPDNIVMRELYRYALENSDAPGIVFDGFPRNKEQAATLDKVFYKKELRITLVISMIVPDEELTKRIIERGKDSGRTDDNPIILQKRFEVYQQQTHPVINYYKKTQRLFEVDGTQPIEVVSSNIRQIIDDHIIRTGFQFKKTK